MLSLCTVIWDFDNTNYFIYPYIHSNYLKIQLLNSGLLGSCGGQLGHFGILTDAAEPKSGDVSLSPTCSFSLRDNNL